MRKIRLIGTIVAKTIAVLFLLSVLWVLLYTWINPPFTYLMLKRKVEAAANGNNSTIQYQWRNCNQISPNLALAVIASEDQKFYTHNGFDYVEIEKAMKQNQTRKRPRGASTISQQVAKNVFLWPTSSWVRKGFEVYFTVLIEFFWTKERILEMYLNVAEMGNMVFGAEAAANHHFKRSADKLSAEQAALIAATLPNPLRMTASRPSGYVQKRRSQIQTQMRQIGGVSIVQCR